MEGLDLSTRKIVNILLLQQQIPLSTYAKFSEKLTFLTPWYAHGLLLNLIKRRQYRIQGFIGFLRIPILRNTLKVSHDQLLLYYEFQRNWSKKKIDFVKQNLMSWS